MPSFGAMTTSQGKDTHMLLRLSPRLVGSALLVGLIALLLSGFGAQFAPTASANHSPMHHPQGDAQMGTTGGWLDGRDVTFVYNKPFFCAEPPASGADSGCEVGEPPQTAPRGGVIPILYVMTPLGFTPTGLQCPVVGACINHPGTIDVSRIFGAGTENFALPAHSHIVDVAQGGWWELKVIGVTDAAVWEQIAAAKDLDAVRALQAQGVGVTGDIPTNTYLFFDVQG